MTSSNGNIFRVTGHLCGEFTGPRWIPRTKASDAVLWCFSLICARINDWVNNGEAGDLRCYRVHCDVIVMVKAPWYWPFMQWTHRCPDSSTEASNTETVSTCWRHDMLGLYSTSRALFSFQNKKGRSSSQRTRIFPCHRVGRSWWYEIS